jgi:hypothetical protein
MNQPAGRLTRKTSPRRVLAVCVLGIALAGAVAPAAEARRKVTSLPGGLSCKTLKARGYSYGQALQYWELWDEPDNMDADLNGIPCETVYSAADVRRYFP